MDSRIYSSVRNHMERVTCVRKNIPATLLFVVSCLHFKGSSRWKWILCRRFHLRKTKQSILSQTMQRFLHLPPSDLLCSSISSLHSLLLSKMFRSARECCKLARRVLATESRLQITESQTLQLIAKHNVLLILCYRDSKKDRHID